jgi:hypothetical protein
LPFCGFRQERLKEFVPVGRVDDEPFRRRAGLACVSESAGRCRAGGLVDVGCGKYEERVGAAKLEDALLQVASGQCADGLACTLGSGEGYALAAEVVEG